MLTIKYHSLFKKDFKRIKKRGYDIAKMEKVISLLVNETPLPKIYKDHDLKGDYKGCRECHITPDWLLVYQKNFDDLVLILTRTGSHSDLF